jgi:pre-mRNA-splicing factor CWC22
MIEVLFAVRKDQFKAHPAIQSGLDLVDENDQYTHMLTLDDPCEPEPMLGKSCIEIKSFFKTFFSVLDVFKYDEQYEENEEKYKEIRKTILDESSGDEDESSSDSSDSDEEGDGKKDDVDEEEQEVDQGTSKYILLYSACIVLMRCFHKRRVFEISQ